MDKKTIQNIFSIWQSLNPDPKGELDYTNTYTLLVAVALSAQSTDSGVNKATKSLFEKVSTPDEMLALGEEKLIEHIKSIGLYKTKGKNIMLMAQQLVEKHNSQVPNNQKELEELAGVGRKTANVVRNIAFSEPTIAVDTHLFRVSNRIGFSDTTSRLQVEKDLIKLVPEEFKVQAHHWMILHGRYICKARKPDCENCPVSNYCKYYQGKQLKFDFS